MRLELNGYRFFNKFRIILALVVVSWGGLASSSELVAIHPGSSSSSHLKQTTSGWKGHLRTHSAEPSIYWRLATQENKVFSPTQCWTLQQHFLQRIAKLQGTFYRLEIHSYAQKFRAKFFYIKYLGLKLFRE